MPCDARLLGVAAHHVRMLQFAGELHLPLGASTICIHASRCVAKPFDISCNCLLHLRRVGLYGFVGQS